MAKLRTLLQMRTAAKEYADQVNSAFISDATWNLWINDSIDEFWDLLVNSVELYGTKSHSFTLSGTNTHPLPSDFYKLNSVEMSIGGGFWDTLDPYNWEERNDAESVYPLYAVELSWMRPRYCIVDNVLDLRPVSGAFGDYRMWYTPVAPTLTLDGDTIDSINGWHEIVQIDAALKAGIKEEAVVSPLERRKAAAIERIKEMAASRMQSKPSTITNTQRRGFRGYRAV